MYIDTNLSLGGRYKIEICIISNYCEGRNTVGEEEKKIFHEYAKLMHILIFLPSYKHFQTRFHLTSDVCSDMIYQCSLYGCCILPYIVYWIRRSLIFLPEIPSQLLNPLGQIYQKFKLFQTILDTVFTPEYRVNESEFRHTA